ncbi:MAG: VOC family protein [Chloroflexi bacterium]|nr:VOC family protein [Chloroflexota bacterium]
MSGIWTRQSLRRNGEGLQHLRFRVDDFHAAIAELAKAGVKPEWHQEMPGIASFAYMTSDKTSGVIIELFRREQPPGKSP